MKNLQQLMQMGQEMQARMKEIEEELENRTVTATAGGGMVEAVADGKGKIREVRIEETVVDPDDVEMLEDLVLAAVSEAQKRAEELHQEEMKKVTGGLPFPLPLDNLL